MSLPEYSRISPDLALTFDDVLLEPASSLVMPGDAKLETSFSQNIKLNIPIVSSAMDTVTEHRLAIALAQMGGIGVIHRNLTASKQAEQVRKVKAFQTLMVKNPINVTPETSIAEVLDLQQRYGISGIPVTDPATRALVGLVTARDTKNISDSSIPVSDIMKKDGLITIQAGADHAEAHELMKKHNIERVIVIDKDKRVVGIITKKDKTTLDLSPFAAIDAFGRLRVAAAVGTGSDHFDRIEMLIDAGVDAIVVDTAHGHSKPVLDMVTHIRRQRSGHVDVVAGNIVTASAAHALIDAGANAVKVGVGPGSICTTRVVAGVGVPQITAVMNVVDVCNIQNIPVIADGGIRMSGDAAKALAAGASSIMLGSLLAGTDETPGDIIERDGKKVKAYRGMGSAGAMAQGSADRYGQKNAKKFTPEGVEATVPARGPVADVIDTMTGGIRASMGYTGCADLNQFRTQTRFVRISNAGLRESHVHSVEQN